MNSLLWYVISDLLGSPLAVGVGGRARCSSRMSDLEASCEQECGLHALSPGMGIRTAWVWIPAVAPEHLVPWG